MTLRPMLFLGLAVLGCGGGGPDPTDTPDASSSGSDGGGSSGDGGGTTSDDRLLPLEVGRRWTYNVTSTYPSCPGGVRESRVLGTGTTEGRPTYHVVGFCGFEGNTNIDGDRVEDYFDWGPTGWFRSLDEPVADGHSWSTTNGSATFGMIYDDVGTHGTYDECWKVTQQVAYTSYWIYCRGVGLVFSEMIDLAGGTIRADLTGTSF